MKGPKTARERRMIRWGPWELVVITAILPIAIYQERWWMVATYPIVVAIILLAYFGAKDGNKLFTRTSWALAIVFFLLALTACSPYYSAEPGPSVPPTVVGMHWTLHSTDSNHCGLELMADGTVAVVSAFNIPAGVATAWLAYGLGIDQGPPGYSIVDCWNISQQNWLGGFDSYVQCYGQPVIKTSWTDYGAYSTWVQIPFCKCDLACQWFSGMIYNFWKNPTVWCSQHLLDLACQAYNNPQQTSAVAEGQTTETPLPPEFSPPAWDATAPIPPMWG